MAVASPLPYLKSGRLRALGVSSATRLAILPDVPTFVGLGYPGVQDYTWIGVFLPAGTPAAIVQRLNEALNRAAQSPDVRKRLEAQALEPVGGTPREFAEYVKAEMAKWGRIVQETAASPTDRGAGARRLRRVSGRDSRHVRRDVITAASPPVQTRALIPRHPGCLPLCDANRHSHQ
jgi:hypothetical protein